MITTFDNYLNEGAEDKQWTSVMLGGSIGEKSVSRVQDLKGMKIKPFHTLYDDRDEAKKHAAESRKNLSPGEKKYYKLTYTTAEVIDGVFTGKA